MPWAASSGHAFDGEECRHERVEDRTGGGPARVASERAAARASRGLAVVELTMRPGEMTPPHVHEDDEALRVLEEERTLMLAAEENGITVLGPPGARATRVAA